MAADQEPQHGTESPAVSAERVGIRALRADLASRVRHAQSGARQIITIDGTPVAQLGPIESTTRSMTIDDLIARGQVIGASRSDRPPPDFTMPMWVGTRLDQLVREVRGR